MYQVLRHTDVLNARKMYVNLRESRRSNHAVDLQKRKMLQFVFIVYIDYPIIIPFLQVTHLN